MSSICELKGDICSLNTLNTRLGNTTAVQIIVDTFGNLEIIDPNNELGAVYSENIGNLSGNGTKVDSFNIDQFGNFQFIP